MRAPRLLHDALVTRPVFVAPDRAGRPGDIAEPGGHLAPLDRCPFCRGNESLTPPPVLRAPPADPGLPAGGPWRSRIVPNQFPIVVGAAPSRDGPPAGGSADYARGVHDVLVESPDHLASITAIDAAGWREAWLLCRDRLRLLAAAPGVAWATVFKNSGAAAGASLVHVHSQIVGLPLVPPTIEAELAAVDPAAPTADVFAGLIESAAAAGRLVAESPAGLVAIVPPAPRQPYETWILPRAPLAFLADAPDAHVMALADLTRWYVGRLESLVPGASYNWWLHQPPFPHSHPGLAAAVRGEPGHSRYRWHLEIVPRINGLAGFELGTGCHASTHLPADCATALRGP
jgi:UDPglucose--hexose-1-phosphate uridylyltransferase